MKKTYLGIFSIFAFALNPIFSDGFIPKMVQESALGCVKAQSRFLNHFRYSEQDREFIAEKGIFPPDDPNNPTPTSNPNRNTQTQKPLLPPEEPNDSTPVPGPSPRGDQNQKPNETEIVPETKTPPQKQINPNNPKNQKGSFLPESETGNVKESF